MFEIGARGKGQEESKKGEKEKEKESSQAAAASAASATPAPAPAAATPHVAPLPERFEDAAEWRPKSYADHFRDSCFSDAELAILAYENAPANYRQAFDATIAQMDALVLETPPRIARLIEAAAEGPLQAGVTGVTRKLQSFVDVASSIINGNMDTLDQSQIDKVMNG